MKLFRKIAVLGNLGQNKDTILKIKSLNPVGLEILNSVLRHLIIEVH